MDKLYSTKDSSSTITKCPVCENNVFIDVIQTKAQMHSSELKFQFQQCQSCELVFLNPRLGFDQLKNFYSYNYLPYRGHKTWGRYAPFVKKSQYQLDKQRMKIVKENHTIAKDSFILDIGCGKPTFLNTCLQEFDCKVTGLDFTDKGWKVTPQQFKGIHLIKGQVKDLKLNEKPTVITMWQYLEHDYNPLETLQKLRSLSGNNTTIIIEVPNYNSHSRKKFGENWAGYHTPRHTFLFSPDNIKKLLIKAGWKVTDIQNKATLDPYLLYWMSRMERKGINWNESMEKRFIKFILGKLSFLLHYGNRKESLGFMLIVAKA